MKAEDQSAEETFPLLVEKKSRKGTTYNVKIYRTVSSRGYASFQVADVSSGVRKLISFSDVDEAKKKAEAICDEMLARVRGEEAIVLRGDARLAYETSVKNLKPSGITLESATFTIAQSVEILGSDRVLEAVRSFAKRNPSKLPKKTVREVVQEMIEAKTRAGLGERYTQDLRYRLGKFADGFECPIASVAGASIQTWLDKMKLSPRSQINFRRVLGTLFEFAKRKGYLLKDHDEIESLERVKARGGKIEIYSPEELARLLSAAGRDFLPCLVIGAFCGLRSAEIEKLDWREVHLTEKFIEVTAGKSKTASRRIAPIPNNAIAWLSPLVKKSGPVWRGTHDDFYDAQQDTAVATKAKGVDALNWKANGLRHSFISYRLAETQNVNQVSLESGNSPGVVHGHYKELVQPAEARSWFSIVPTIPVNVASMEKVSSL